MDNETHYTENGYPYYISSLGEEGGAEAVFHDGNGAILTDRDCKDIAAYIRIANDECKEAQ